MFTKNYKADQVFREKKNSPEWKQNTHVFQVISEIVGMLEIDLIASRPPHLLSEDNAWKPGPLSITAHAI